MKYFLNGKQTIDFSIDSKLIQIGNEIIFEKVEDSKKDEFLKDSDSQVYLENSCKRFIIKKIEHHLRYSFRGFHVGKCSETYVYLEENE